MGTGMTTTKFARAGPITKALRLHGGGNVNRDSRGEKTVRSVHLTQNVLRISVFVIVTMLYGENAFASQTGGCIGTGMNMTKFVRIVGRILQNDQRSGQMPVVNSGCNKPLTYLGMTAFKTWTAPLPCFLHYGELDCHSLCK